MKIRKLYEAIGVSFSLYVVNRYSENDPHDVSYLRSRLDLGKKEVIFTVKDESVYSKLAEIDEQLIINYRCPGFSEDMKDIVFELMKIADLSISVKDSGKRKIFGFM